MDTYLWIVIVAFISGFITSCGIGANDVANSFATSVGAGVLTLKQALIIASIFEFAGAVAMGSRVTDTVRKKIVDHDIFSDDIEILMFGMLCASMATGIWLAIATYFKAPVSTTHSTIGSILGFAMVYAGYNNEFYTAINWDKVWLIVASWIISPLIAGILTAIIFGINRHGALRSKHVVERSLRILPVMVFLAVGIITFFIIYKGTPQLDLDDTSLGVSIGTSFGIGIGVGLIAWLFIKYYLRDKVHEKIEMKNLREQEAQEMSANAPVDTSVDTPVNTPVNTLVETQIDVNIEKETPVETQTSGVSTTRETSNYNNVVSELTKTVNGVTQSDSVVDEPLPNLKEETETNDTQLVNVSLDETVEVEVEAEAENVEDVPVEKTIGRYHSEKFTRMENFDEEAESLFSYLQIFTACVSAFAHGSNDIANSIAPVVAIYTIYDDGTLSKKSEVPIWILAIGGLGICVGLWFWGKRIIDRLGKELSGVSPSRGFSIELGAAMAVVTASRLELPVSTTHCQVGSIVGSGMMDTFRSGFTAGCKEVWHHGLPNVDLKIFGKILFGWVITLPVTMVISGALFSFAYFSPA